MVDLAEEELENVPDWRSLDGDRDDLLIPFAIVSAG